MDKKLKETILNPILKGNPITVLILGICSSLAVTVQLKGALVMALSVIVVTGLSSLVCSLLRNTIPMRVRIIVQLVVVAMMVILVDQILKAGEGTYAIDKQLSVYIGLIITNCIVMGRIEAFALGNKPIPSLLDGLANGVGYGLILIIVAFFRASRKRHPVRPAGPACRLYSQQPRDPAAVRADPARMHHLGTPRLRQGPSGEIIATPYGIHQLIRQVNLR